MPSVRGAFLYDHSRSGVTVDCIEFSAMNRSDLQKLSRLRESEAAVLLKARRFQGAYYLLGYAVECALKACIAKQVRRHDFPDRDVFGRAYVHNLEQLVLVAGLTTIFNLEKNARPQLALNWAIVKDWKETSRHSMAISRTEANEMYVGCTDQSDGVLPWIRQRW